MSAADVMADLPSTRGRGRFFLYLLSLFVLPGCADTTPIYQHPLWEWRRLDLPTTEFRFSASKSLIVPNVQSLFRVSFDDDSENRDRPEMYFFLVPQTGVLVDWSRVGHYGDMAQVNFSFWQSVPEAYAVIGLHVSSRATGSSANPAGPQAVGNPSGQTTIGGRTFGYVCKSLPIDDSNMLALECGAVASTPFGGVMKIVFSNPRGDDPVDRLTKIASHVLKIEASFQIKAHP